MKHVISWSGGKDSTATIILAHEKGLPVDLIIISLLWFDKKRKIYAEYPEHIEWIFDYAIPLFESWGYKVKVVTSEKDYLDNFYHVVTKSPIEERNGKFAAWVIGGMCRMNEYKVSAIKKFLKLFDERVEYVGIAADETGRLEKLHAKKNKISLLEKFGIEEKDTWPLCEKYNLLSPHYKVSNRGGCWFCPNQKIEELAFLKTHYPELWQELKTLAGVENKVSDGFKYGKTFFEVEAMVDKYIQASASQVSLFDARGVIL